jgi:hypothetical protein
MNPIVCSNHTHDGPYDPVCGQAAENIPSVILFAKENRLTPAAWVMAEEGTYNPATRHFLCDSCFIAEEQRRGSRLAGQNGTPWKCP